MANNALVSSVLKVITDRRDKFIELDQANGNLLNFETECLFAKQQLLKNDYSLKVAGNNQQSLASAILNVGAIGLSLNPANQQAFLVPRDGMICLDISYRGIIQIGIDSGAIQWCRPEIVCKNDSFKWKGPTAEPEHEADIFGDRGDMIGVYCVTKLAGGDIFCGTMNLEEIHKIRDRSMAYARKKAGPWAEWFNEMSKKAIIKRDYKTWPQSSGRLARAVEVLNEQEGTAYSIEQHARYMEALQNNDWLEFSIMRHEVGDDIWTALYNSFEKGHKTEGKKRVTELEKAGNNGLEDMAQEIEVMLDSDDNRGVVEYVAGIPGTFIKDKITTRLSPAHKNWLHDGRA